MQYYSYRIDRKVYRCNMFKETCLIVLKKKRSESSDIPSWNPRMLHLEVFIWWPQNDSCNAQAYNHINATIMRIGIAWRERGCDSENFGTRIIWFRVTIEKIWRKEVQRPKLEFWKPLGLKYEFGKCWGPIWKIPGALVKRICNLEQGEGFMCKIEWSWANL
jgi:hypothetical protein